MGPDDEQCAVALDDQGVEQDAMLDQWDAALYRERAEVWRQRAVMLSESEIRTSCIILAAEYSKLAGLVEAEAQRILPAREA